MKSIVKKPSVIYFVLKQIAKNLLISYFGLFFTIKFRLT